MQNGPGTIALAGASGSHPSLIRLIVDAIARLPGSPRVTVFDMSAFDRRGVADYSGLAANVIKPDPGEARIASRFTTAGPNILLSGGNPAFARLQAMFDRELAREDVGVLLACHCWGLPEQALIRAARARGSRVVLIDEGPFSLPLNGTQAPETSRALKAMGLRLVRALGLFPPRDMTGALIDTVLVTAPGRQRQLIARGVPSAKIRVIPPPRFDRLSGIARQWPERGAGTHGARVLWLHQPFRVDGKVAAAEVDRAEAVLAEALVLLARRRPLQVKLRMHPRSGDEEARRVERLLTGRGLALANESRSDLYEDFLRSDAAVGFYSSALLEASACGMPTAAVALDRKAFAEQNEADKAEAMPRLGVPTGRTAEEIMRVVDQGLEAGTLVPPARMIDEEIGSLEGCGADTVARILVEQLALARSAVPS